MKILQSIKYYSYQVVLFFFSIVMFVSCASSPMMIQPEINSLVAAEKFDYALKVLKNNQNGYGDHNQLLYHLDYGLLLHLAGRHRESIDAFERAKTLYGELYTISLSKQAGTWIVNDRTAPYRGEDFERVMINVFQALNFAILGDFEKSLVEARNVDSQLNLINDQYSSGEKNVYKEDAFARLLMGILYESSGDLEGLNNALISYQKAFEIYKNDYSLNYGMDVPLILKENMLALTEYLKIKGHETFHNKFANVPYIDFETKLRKAEIYLVRYHGLSPIKHQISVPIPLGGGYLSNIAFPQYYSRELVSPKGSFIAVDGDRGENKGSFSLGEDIGKVAIQNLENRKVRIIAKAGARSAAKHLIMKKQVDHIDRKYGNDKGEMFQYISNLYVLGSEQADLRSWQTLPAQIYISRLLLEPGVYDLFVGNDFIGSIIAERGDKKFFTFRATY